MIQDELKEVEKLISDSHTELLTFINALSDKMNHLADYGIIMLERIQDIESKIKHIPTND